MQQLTIGDIEQLEEESGYALGEIMSLLDDPSSLRMRPLIALARLGAKQQGKDITLDEVRAMPYMQAMELVTDIQWDAADPKENPEPEAKPDSV
ncbi:hypothetical protein [Actinomyces sp.]|uniref:hypothetical protein n=1 Tax=Actinomyces sp. TaxID=29317 RepID=UPI002912BF25|nr:hypothetical protein [Actinomyces sp.]MDU6757763.1 hypothetical protein [Actinomyces sp.]